MNKLSALFTIKRLLECRLINTRLTADGKEIPKKKNFENRITLIGTDNVVSITDLKNAQNLSHKRELKLVKIQDVDSKTRRPVYKLMSSADYHDEEVQKRKERQEVKRNASIKGEKLLTLSSRIGEHDLMTGVKKIMKLLEKQYEVRVVVAGDNADATQNLDKIYATIEKHTKAMGSVVQKRNKGNNLKFQILPSKDSSSSSARSNSNSEDSKKGPINPEDSKKGPMNPEDSKKGPINPEDSKKGPI